MYEGEYCLVCTVRKTACLMQPGEILVLQLHIMFVKGIQTKVQRILSEDLHRHLLFIKTQSALKFKHGTKARLGKQLMAAGGGTGAVTFSCTSQRLCVPPFKAFSEACWKGQAGVEQQEELDRWKKRQIW